jgi:hypothetical protein
LGVKRSWKGKEGRTKGEKSEELATADRRDYRRGNDESDDLSRAEHGTLTAWESEQNGQEKEAVG